MAIQHFLTGELLNGTYSLARKIGQGGFGVVYEGLHVRLQRKVAVKLLSGQGLIAPEYLERFRLEAEVMSQLRHPNIVDVLDVNETDQGIPYIVMEFLTGEPLEQKLRREQQLAWDDVCTIVAQVGSALEALHAHGYVHRDLSPRNIFLADNLGQGISVKVIDFGVSKVMDAARQLTGIFQVVGTPFYMSPEQASGASSSVSAAADIFVFGAVTYEMISGHRAWLGKSAEELCRAICHVEPGPLAEHRPDVPAAVEKAVRWALAKLPEDRPTARAFTDAVTDAIRSGFHGQKKGLGDGPTLEERILTGDPTQVDMPAAEPVATVPDALLAQQDVATVPHASVASAGARGHRRRWVLVSIAVVVACGLAAGAWILFVRPRQRPAAMGAGGDLPVRHPDAAVARADRGTGAAVRLQSPDDAPLPAKAEPRKAELRGGKKIARDLDRRAAPSKHKMTKKAARRAGKKDVGDGLIDYDE